MLRIGNVSNDQTSDHRLQMSSMIDIVFLLLVFFVMTFRITPQEGDFTMDATEVAGSGRTKATTNLPLNLVLDADGKGDLLAMRLNGDRIWSLEELQMRLIGLDADGALKDVVMTLHCASNLKYQNVIAVMDHVTAYRDAVGRRRPLITSTRFANRR